MIRPFGGINEEAISPLQRRFQLLRRRQLAVRHQLERHQGIIQNRRELMQVFVGSRPRHRKLRAQDIKGGRRFLIVEDKQEFLHQGGQFPCGATARATPACAGLAPFFLRVLLGCSVEITEDAQQRVAWGLGQAWQSFPLTLVSDVQSHR